MVERPREPVGFDKEVLNGSQGRSPHLQYADHKLAKTFSKYSRFLRMFSVTISAVSPSAQHSTMTGPLKPAFFNSPKTAGKSTLPVLNWSQTLPCFLSQSLAQKPVTC